MSKKILEEVRAISSEKIAEKQKTSENGYPQIIEKVKRCAGFGETQCQFSEYEIDQYSKRLLEQDGFTVYITQKPYSELDNYYTQRRKPENVWIVKW